MRDMMVDARPRDPAQSSRFSQCLTDSGEWVRVLLWPPHVRAPSTDPVALFIHYGTVATLSLLRVGTGGLSWLLVSHMPTHATDTAL